MKTLSLAAAILLTAAPASAQDNPTPAQTQAARSGPCEDPWITIAYKRMYGDGFVPAKWMCKTKLYNGGSWSNFAQLQTAVRAKDYGLYTYRGVVLTGSGPLAGRTALGIFQGNSLVAAGGGNLIAAGAGNLVAAGGGNLVAAGGGNLVAAGGGNVIMRDPAGGLVSPGPRTLLSAGTTPVRVID